MKKKILSLVLAAIFVFAFVATNAVCVFAAGPSLTVTKVKETESTVTVAVGISGNTGISALGVNLTYDPTLVSYEQTEGSGVASAAGMAVFGNDVGGEIKILVDENGKEESGTKENGNVCLVTFKKLSSVKDGSTADFTASSIPSLTYGSDGNDVEIADASAKVALKKVETTTKKPAEKPVAKPDQDKTPAETTTKKVVTTTKKPVVTTKPNVVSPTLPGVVVNTTSPEMTTEETTTEEFTTAELITEYESYSYTAPEQVDTDEDNDSGSTKRIIAIVVVVVCIGAAVVLYLTKKKDSKKEATK